MAGHVHINYPNCAVSDTQTSLDSGTWPCYGMSLRLPRLLWHSTQIWIFAILYAIKLNINLENLRSSCFTRSAWLPREHNNLRQFLSFPIPRWCAKCYSHCLVSICLFHIVYLILCQIMLDLSFFRCLLEMVDSDVVDQS